MKKIVFFLCFFLMSFIVPAKNVKVILVMDQDDDKQIVLEIFTSMMAAQKVQAILDLEDAPMETVSDDLFVFSIKNEETQKAIMHIFDEEGFEVVGKNSFDIHSGSTYKCLNVQSLSDGTYLIQVESENGDHLLAKKIAIQQ